MTDSVSQQANGRSPLDRLFQNPVILKELRSRMRGRRAFVVLTIYLLLMSGLISLVYIVYAASAGSNPFGPQSRQAGKVIVTTVLFIQVFLVLFITPAFTAGAISGEKERQTYDLLRTTLLPARSVITGKLFSALSYILLLIFASVPLQSIAFLLGGVSPVELLLSQLLIVISAFAFAMIGLFFSTFMRSTLAASVASYGTILLLTLGAPLLALILVSFLGPFLFGVSSTPWPLEALFLVGGLLLASTNLPASLIVSDLLLVEEDVLLFTSQVIDGHTVIIFSPWILYAILYIIVTLILFWACVRRVRRIAP